MDVFSFKDFVKKETKRRSGGEGGSKITCKGVRGCGTFFIKIFYVKSAMGAYKLRLNI